MLLVEIGGHERVWQCRAPGQLGGHLPGQQRERRQAQNRAHPQGQRLGQKAAVRVRPGCSTNALRTQGQVRRADHPKGHKKSVVALAHKMLRTIYAMLTNGSHYQDKEVDYEALNVQRNAPRWIKMLRKRLHRHARCRLRLALPADLGPWPASGHVV